MLHSSSENHPELGDCQADGRNPIRGKHSNLSGLLLSPPLYPCRDQEIVWLPHALKSIFSFPVFFESSELVIAMIPSPLGYSLRPLLVLVTVLFPAPFVAGA